MTKQKLWRKTPECLSKCGAAENYLCLPSSFWIFKILSTAILQTQTDFRLSLYWLMQLIYKSKFILHSHQLKCLEEIKWLYQAYPDLGWLYGYLHLLLAIGRDASPNYGFIPLFGGGGGRLTIQFSRSLGESGYKGQGRWRECVGNLQVFWREKVKINVQWWTKLSMSFHYVN